MTEVAPKRGRFVVLEGIDGAGTTTQTERLASALRGEGLTVVTTREPSDGPIGVQIRQALTGRLGLPGGKGPLGAGTLALLFAADRLDHLESTVIPALDRGAWVISDRYLLSSLAYQGASLEMAWVARINAYARAPDLTLFLEVQPKIAKRRRAARGGDEELFDDDEKQRKIAAQYLAAVRLRDGAEAIRRVDGSLSADAVTAACLASLRAELGSAMPGAELERRAKGPRRAAGASGRSRR